LKCKWTSTKSAGASLTIQRAFNIHTMYDNKLALSDRIHTFEALAQKGVNKGAAVANCCTLDSDVPYIIHEEILAAITQIEVHLLNDCGIVLSEGTFYFKFDKKDILYLTFVAGLRAASQED